QFMVSGDVTIWIPNPHQGDIGRELLSRNIAPGPHQSRGVGKAVMAFWGIAAMTPYVQQVRFRKFAPVDREYPIFELVEGDDVLLDVSSSDDGVLEVALHEASIGKVFKLDDLHAILMQGKRLLEEDMAYES